MSYQEKLLDERWGRKRKQILIRDNYTCVGCGINGNEDTLHVHHVKYIYGLNPWEYEDELLETLCQDCHSCLHERISARKEAEERRGYNG